MKESSPNGKGPEGGGGAEENIKIQKVIFQGEGCGLLLKRVCPAKVPFRREKSPSTNKDEGATGRKNTRESTSERALKLKSRGTAK